MTCVNDLLESLATRLDSDMMEKVVDMLTSIGLQMDGRSYEIFLGMYFTTRSFQEVCFEFYRILHKNIGNH